MTDASRKAEAVGSKASSSGENLTGARPLGWLARAGLVARGVVYLVIGFLALKVAFGEGGKTTDQEGAMKAITAQPLGKALLVLLAIGLAAYAIWRLTRAIVGHGAEQEDDTMDRVSAGASAGAYAILCVTAVEILVTSGGGSSSPKETTSGVLGWPGGPVLVAVAGIVLIGVAIYQGYKGLAKDFLEDANTGEMSPTSKKAYTALGLFGHVARSVVFALIGYGLIKAALDYEPKEAVGLDGALQKLADSSPGPVLLALVAAGLAGFALYSIADARYRKV